MSWARVQVRIAQSIVDLHFSGCWYIYSEPDAGGCHHTVCSEVLLEIYGVVTTMLLPGYNHRNT